MFSGKLRHRITIQQLTNTSDEMGGSVQTWVDFITIWASIEPLQGKELFAAQQVHETLSHKVTIRYHKDVVPSMRVNYNGRLFNIRSVIDTEERHIQLQMLCEELQAG